MRLTGTCVLVLGIFAFAGSAVAGNGNGNGNGGDASPVNSANAPGQVKKDSPPTASTAPATTTTTTTSTTTAPVAPAPAPTDGIKPSNTTAHETHAPASSNDTKKYGNGQTAGGIAMHNGAKPSTVLHGPGNSQPHKAAPCSGGHEVDVHALKPHRGGSCGGPQPDPKPKPAPNPTPPPGPAPGPNPSPPSGPTADTNRPADPGASRQQPGGAAGRRATASAHADEGEGAVAAEASASQLPFTGMQLWLAVLTGLVLVAAGVALRRIRLTEAAVEFGHDHPHRARHAARGSGSAIGGRARR
jgi:hypothetical protein